MKTGMWAIVVGIILTAGFIGITVMSNRSTTSATFQQLTISGNVLLKTGAYLSYAGLQSTGPLTLRAAEIRDRLIRHPYVMDVTVQTTRQGYADVMIHEKAIAARMLTAHGEYLLSALGQTLPLLPGTRNPDVPLISGVTGDAKTVMNEQERRRVASAFRLICGTALDTVVLSKSVSEIILRDNGTMLVTISGLNPVFITDEKNLERQTAYLYHFLLTKNNFDALTQSAEYVDLRFEKKIFIGS